MYIDSIGFLETSFHSHPMVYCPEHMSFIVGIILPYLLLYKYWAIFAITFVAALAFPIPPGTLLMASAAFASQGYFSFFWVVAIGSLGNIAGDNLGYFLARHYGRRVLSRIGFRKTIESQKYKNIEKRIQTNPGFLIFISRFEVVSNLAVNIICGLGEVPYGKYLFFEVVGEIAQVFVYCLIGYLVGDNWPAISAIISKFMLAIIVVVGVLVIVFWKRILRRLSK